MECEVCGEDCRCGLSAQAPSGLAAEADDADLSEQEFEASLAAETNAAVASPRAGVDFTATPAEMESENSAMELAAAAEDRPPVAPSATFEVTNPHGPEIDPEAWRNEVAARLQHYRSRHKPKPPRYPSLWLRFEDEPPPALTRPAVIQEAVARDEFADRNSGPPPEMRDMAVPEAIALARVLAFPRSSSAPQARPQELADPVPSQPRILEAPEIPAPPPALGGILIGAPHEEARRGGEEVRVRPASVRRRLLAWMVDGLTVVSACALAAEIFWRITRVRPPLAQLTGLSLAGPVVLWAVYQYLLVVYAGKTPGLWLASLEMVGLDGSDVTRSKRRWRVLASFLSLASLGLGYLWALMEADSFTWHDRMSGTCLVLKPDWQAR